jgi:hypothetical protein
VERGKRGVEPKTKEVLALERADLGSFKPSVDERIGARCEFFTAHNVTFESIAVSVSGDRPVSWDFNREIGFLGLDESFCCKKTSLDLRKNGFDRNDSKDALGGNGVSVDCDCGVESGFSVRNFQNGRSDVLRVIEGGTVRFRGFWQGIGQDRFDFQ